MKEKWSRGLNKYGRLLAGLGVLLCAAGLLVSYVRPKQKLETVSVNMAVEGESSISLEAGTTVEYRCSTRGYPMAGIQVGLTKYGKELTNSQLLMRVYDSGRTRVLSESLISMSDVDEGQYLYLPFDNYEACNGELIVEFSGSTPQGEQMGLLTNQTLLEDAATCVNGATYAGNLKSYYVYRVDYYPLLFDLLTGLFLFAAVFFLTKPAGNRFGRGAQRGEAQVSDVEMKIPETGKGAAAHE